MEKLKYKVITSKTRYKEYCKFLEQLVFSDSTDRNTKDEIALLTLLIEKWDTEHISSTELDPIQLLHSFIKDRKLRAKDLVSVLGISKGYVSDILHYKKGLSKEVIRKLAYYFKISQDAFNRPYKLVSENSHWQNASVINRRKKSWLICCQVNRSHYSTNP